MPWDITDLGDFGNIFDEYREHVSFVVTFDLKLRQGLPKTLTSPFDKKLGKKLFFKGYKVIFIYHDWWSFRQSL